jgi:hypothetical protein
MSKTEQQADWETLNVVSIPMGIEVVMKIREEGGGINDGGEVILPAIALLHQSLMTGEIVSERIVLGVLDMDNGSIMAAEPEQVVEVIVMGDEGDDQDGAEDGQDGAAVSGEGRSIGGMGRVILGESH